MVIKMPEGYSFSGLVERAVRNAVSHTAGESLRWVAVRDTFATGSTVAGTTVAIEICKAYGLDPHERISGVDCLACNP